MTETSDKTPVTVARYALIGVIGAAVVTGLFGLLTKCVEITGNTNNLNRPTNLSNNLSTNFSSGNNVSETTNVNNGQVKSIQVGSRRVITLEAPDTNSIDWRHVCCESEVLFTSTDSNDWAKVEISGKEHFAGFYIELTDSLSGLDNEVFYANRINEGEDLILKTEKFKAVATPIEVIKGADPDTVKQYPLVLKKVILNIKVESVESNPKEAKNSNINR